VGPQTAVVRSLADPDPAKRSHCVWSPPPDHYRTARRCPSNLWTSCHHWMEGGRSASATGLQLSRPPPVEVSTCLASAAISMQVSSSGPQCPFYRWPCAMHTDRRPGHVVPQKPSTHSAGTTSQSTPCACALSFGHGAQRYFLNRGPLNGRVLLDRSCRAAPARSHHAWVGCRESRVWRSALSTSRPAGCQRMALDCKPSYQLSQDGVRL